jgi:enoyl-CoA hydratase/carnithine racemase
VSVVRYEVVRRVGWLTIDRPEARNALSAEVRRLLTEGFERFAADDDAAVLVLTGTGEKAFCAGGDLREMADTGLTVPPPDFVPQPGRTVQLDKPVIAAVNGIAYGGGFLLAQQCDLVLAAEHARFAVSEAKLGRGAPWAAPLAWLVPPRVAMQLLVTGDPISAQRAHEVGLVNEVVSADQLHDAAQTLGERIAANAPLSVAAAKATVRLMAQPRFADAYAEAEALWEPVYLSADAQEGPAAFRDKRTPVWTGR